MHRRGTSIAIYFLLIDRRHFRRNRSPRLDTTDVSAGVEITAMNLPRFLIAPDLTASPPLAAPAVNQILITLEGLMEDRSSSSSRPTRLR